MANLYIDICPKPIGYDIYINNDEIKNLKYVILDEIKNNRYIIVFSEKVYKLYSDVLDFPKANCFILKDGEKEKNYKNYLKILEFAMARNLKRNDFIIAIGGGVVGDISGFVASTYMRGINFIQVPTTLLAATDSSVGGKVAINSGKGKNLIGAFYQPKSVFININFLKTLDEKQFKSGLGEVIKYSFIEKNCKPECEDFLINYLLEHQQEIFSRDSLVLEEIIKRCIDLKRVIVEQDEKESGLRKILNYGHTYGHAIETLTKYREYTHGQCVVEGIKFAINLSFSLNIIDKEYKFLCEDLIKKFDYPPLKKLNPQKIIDTMKSDKKATNNSINFILPSTYATVEEYGFTIDKLEKMIKFAI